MTPAVLDATVTVPDDVLFRTLEGEAIILNLATGVYFGLDPVGTCLWTALAEYASVRRAVDAVCEAYAVSRAQAEGDAVDLINQLVDKGLVQLVASGGTHD